MTGTAAPIGVFDSGIGGLTVVRELRRQLPAEDIIYFGDTARVPYGPKSPETVQRYSREIAAFLLMRDVKAIVIACNTATAHALPLLEAELPVPVIGVIGPGARAAVRAADSGGIGVIGTIGTVRSGAYERAIAERAPHANVTARACPLFVPFVEEGWTDHPATRLVAEEYLAPLRTAGVNTLVLGCTHYPLLKPVIADVVGPEISLIDSAQETAAETGAILRQRQLAAPTDRRGVAYYVVSDAADHFARTARHFLGAPLQLVETLTLG
ncbi:MAG: glutamate racemase [Candidatus Eremiobacteraeota bacterium]|nr:glutamate racemase [Candidatus Eremiobacteraeota bacterium]